MELVRRTSGAAKAGHGGTLDPFSEGVLPIALGQATKTLAMVLEGEKSYRCWVRFGAETDSGDPTGQVVAETGLSPEPAALEALLPRFRGEISQVPPAHSALHVDGVRAYTLARQGIPVDLPARRVTIHDLELESFSGNMAVLRVRCSKGTYMRSLARDLGRELGCLAHLIRLMRIATLGFTIDEVVSLEQIQEAATEGRIEALLHPIDRVLADIPALRLEVEAWHRIRTGQAAWVTDPTAATGTVRLYDPQGRFVALGELMEPSAPHTPHRCLPRRLFHVP